MLVLSNYSSGIQGRPCCLSDAPSVRLIFRNQLVASNKVKKACTAGKNAGKVIILLHLNTREENLLDGIDKASGTFTSTADLLQELWSYFCDFRLNKQISCVSVQGSLS